MPEIPEATPLEYQERWIASTEEGVQVVISQPLVAGSYSGKAEIQREPKYRNSP